MSHEAVAVAKPALRAYVELTKPRIVTMVAVTAALGYFLGGGGIASAWTLLWLMIGTALVCGGSATLNQFLEVEVDRRMHRTRNRPIPSGAVSSASAMTFGVYQVLGGTTLLLWGVNLVTAFLALLTVFLYVLVYTPLKQVTWVNTLIGAVPGALPPLGGWTAATGEIGAGGLALFAVLFLWQLPHFYAISWMYRDDYARGGLRMLSVVEPSGVSTFRHILATSALLIPVSLLLVALGLCGWPYAVGAVLLGVMLIRPGLALRKSRSAQDARSVLRASVLYLPALLLLVVVDFLV